jgi:FixJ family two-component response regulator
MNKATLAAEGRALPARKVHVVDDEPSVLRALARLLELHGFEVSAYTSSESFLGAYDPGQAGCALVDVAMPAMDGLALQQALLERGGPPVVFLTGSSDVPTCARAMRNGAVHFLRKPVDEVELVRALEDALQRDADARARQRLQHDVHERLSQLTEREAEVLGLVMEGRLNKQIAHQLGIAEKTVKVHRARGMEKMGVRAVAQLVRVVERSGQAALRWNASAPVQPRPSLQRRA